MMAGSPVSFNILKGKLMSFLYNIQHAKMFIKVIYADVNDFNVLLRFFFIFPERLRSSPGGGQGGVSYVICKLNLYLLRNDVPLNNYTILVFIKPPKSLLLI